MPEHKVLVVLPVEQSHKKMLETTAGGRCSFVYKQPGDLSDEDVSDAEVIIGNVSPELVKNAEKLSLLQLNSAGFEAYTKSGVMRKGSVLCNARGAYSLTVGEHMLAFTFELVRHLHRYRDNQLECRWESHGAITSVEGATVAVLGMGDIGSFYARKVKALGAECVIGVRHSLRNRPDFLDEQYTLSELDKVLPRADIVAMVLPDSEETRHIINKNSIGLMKKGAYLINVGRGSAIETEALKEALESGHLAGCALDVTEPEPLPENSPLWKIPNVIITPHVAGNFYLKETFERVVRIADKNLKAWLEGQELANVVLEV